MGLKLERYSESLKVVQKTVSSVVAIVLVYFGHGVEGVLVADILASCVIIIASLAILSNHLDIPSAIQQGSPIGWSSIMSYTSATILFFIGLTSLYHVDILMISWWSDSNTVGYYKGALIMAQALWILPTSVQLSLLQSTAEHWQHGEHEVINQLASRLTRLITLLTTLMAIGLAVLVEPAVSLYLGADFGPTTTPLLLLLPGVVGFAVARPVLAINQASGRMRPLIIATMASAVINLVANTLLIPRFGMAGAAVGTSLGYGSLPVFQSVAAHKLGYSPFSGLPVGRIMFTALLTGGFLYVVHGVLPSNITALLVIPPLGAVVFGLLAFWTGALSDADVQVLKENIPISAVLGWT
jgi:O-antigen/teichoic acid export membrane protein